MHSLNAGGIENYLLRFLEFKRDGLDATVYCKSGELGQLLDRYKSLDIEIVANKLSYLNPFGYCKLYFFLKNENYSSVTDFTGNFGALVLMMSQLAGIKTRIAFYRNSSNRFKGNRLKLWLNSFFNKSIRKSATNILANSKYAFEFFFDGNIDSRFQVIQNGINVNSLSKGDNYLTRSHIGVPDNAIVIGNVGRYVEAKNHKVILSVLQRLQDQDDFVYLVLCGKGVDNQLIDNFSIDKGRVKALGYRNDIMNILPLLDIFFFPSITEGQPNALIEAMANGLPFVASNIEPIVDTVPDIRLGDLYAYDDVDSFVDALNSKIKLLKGKDEELRQWTLNRYNSGVNFDKYYDIL